MAGNRDPVTSRKDSTASCKAENSSLHYINTSEIPGFLHLLKNHIFIARSEDTTFNIMGDKLLLNFGAKFQR